MAQQVTAIKSIQGLAQSSVPALQHQYGKNNFSYEKQRRRLHILADLAREPMLWLLIVACVLYFILGEQTEGIIMLIAVCLVAAIAVYEEVRSAKAIEALKQYTAPGIMVIRDAVQQYIATSDLVPGDVVVLEEGNKVPADATVIHDNDFSVNESVITGESMPVEKHADSKNNSILQGSTVQTGKCYAIVTSTGNNTVLGKLGKTVAAITTPKTPLQQQVNRFVHQLAIFGISAFVVILLVNYLKTGLPVQSLLFALTLAMAAVPEEIPVAFSSFMALGAWQLSKRGIISRQPQIIENLGSVNMLCLDKTGTITENKMAVLTVYDFHKDVLTNINNLSVCPEVLRMAMLASESAPFDPMEIAIHEAYRQQVTRIDGDQLHTQVYEYPLEGIPPMMTHVYQLGNSYQVAGKGAPERILRICNLNAADSEKVDEYVLTQAIKGFRVIAVASAVVETPSFPATQDAFNWQFEGLVCLFDPPRPHMATIIKELYDAHIDIKIITGDHAETAIYIAEQIGVKGYLKHIDGEAVMTMENTELQREVEKINLFVRMFPEAKLKVINAIKANGYTVAMTGDGVNDAPALKAADVGIALGKKGTEMARQAADLIITDDDLGKVLYAVKQGRKIFSNLKKAIRYIISIHIPIILTASVPVIVGWKYPNIFSPLHIIFLELIMGPTCSLFFEREPAEENAGSLVPRKRSDGLFEQDELLISIVQGILIAVGVLWLYYFPMYRGASLPVTRTIVFTTLIICNILLTFTNRSFTENFTRTWRYKNNLAPWVFGISVAFLLALHLLPPVQALFGLASLSTNDLLLCIGVSIISVGWFEVYKTHQYKPDPVIPRHKNEKL